MNNEQFLLKRLNQGSKEAYSFFFNQYYKDLVLFAGTYIREKETCEDIVQSIFLKLWSDREEVVIQTSLKSFLLTSVRNSCLDALRHEQVIRDHEAYAESFSDFENFDTENYILYSDLHQHLTEALDKIPQEYKNAFTMNRFEGLKYREIALQLNVSERTIEVRIGKAIGLLRQYLKDFIILLFTLISIK